MVTGFTPVIIKAEEAAKLYELTKWNGKSQIWTKYRNLRTGLTQLTRKDDMKHRKQKMSNDRYFTDGRKAQKVWLQHSRSSPEIN